jgi:hypothetical protein
MSPTAHGMIQATLTAEHHALVNGRDRDYLRLREQRDALASLVQRDEDQARTVEHSTPA